MSRHTLQMRSSRNRSFSCRIFSGSASSSSSSAKPNRASIAICSCFNLEDFSSAATRVRDLGRTSCPVPASSSVHIVSCSCPPSWWLLGTSGVGGRLGMGHECARDSSGECDLVCVRDPPAVGSRGIDCSPLLRKGRGNKGLGSKSLPYEVTEGSLCSEAALDKLICSSVEDAICVRSFQAETEICVCRRMSIIHTNLCQVFMFCFRGFFLSFLRFRKNSQTQLTHCCFASLVTQTLHQLLKTEPWSELLVVPWKTRNLDSGVRGGA